MATRSRLDSRRADFIKFLRLVYARRHIGFDSTVTADDVRHVEELVEKRGLDELRRKE